MVLIRVKGDTFVYVLETTEVCKDSDELITLKARTVRGVSKVEHANGVCAVHIQKLGRGPLACEQAIEDAFK